MPKCKCVDSPKPRWKAESKASNEWEKKSLASGARKQFVSFRVWIQRRCVWTALAVQQGATQLAEQFFQDHTETPKHKRVAQAICHWYIPRLTKTYLESALQSGSFSPQNLPDSALQTSRSISNSHRTCAQIS